MSLPAPRSQWRGRFSLPVLALLAGCALPGTPPPGSREAQAQQSLVDACRRRADVAYDITHRGDIYAPQSQVNTPYSADYQPGAVDRGLSTLYERDRMISDCVRNTGAEGDRMPPGQAVRSPPPSPHVLAMPPASAAALPPPPPSPR